MTLTGCGHILCVPCGFGYFKSQIESGQAVISCLKCNAKDKNATEIAHFNIQQLVDDALYERFLKNGAETAIAKNDDLKNCIRPDCKGYGIIYDNQFWC